MPRFAHHFIAIFVGLAIGPAVSLVHAQDLNLSGRSYGGKVRAGPSMQDAQVGSTALNERIVLLSRAGRMGDYDWFRVRTASGVTGYQWGGLVCANGEETGVLTICGSPQDGELSGLNKGQALGPIDRSGTDNVRTYSCNEGIPLRVRFVEEGQDSVAYVSHDSFPEVRMVKPYGSNGDQYEAGNSSISGRNGEFTIKLNGIEDFCRAD